MSEHTPGPWGRTDMGEIIANGKTVAFLVGPGGNSDADGRLIAAAPELLETLRVARERIQEDRDSLFESVVSQDGSNQVHDEEDRAEVEKYDALLRVIDGDIAKAEGG